VASRNHFVPLTESSRREFWAPFRRGVCCSVDKTYPISVRLPGVQILRRELFGVASANKTRRRQCKRIR
jgi:hypothetical protein